MAVPAVIGMIARILAHPRVSGSLAGAWKSSRFRSAVGKRLPKTTKLGAKIKNLSLDDLVEMIKNDPFAFIALALELSQFVPDVWAELKELLEPLFEEDPNLRKAWEMMRESSPPDSVQDSGLDPETMISPIKDEAELDRLVVAREFGNSLARADAFRRWLAIDEQTLQAIRVIRGID